MQKLIKQQNGGRWTNNIWMTDIWRIAGDTYVSGISAKFCNIDAVKTKIYPLWC
jgi:hypothetical protein